MRGLEPQSVESKDVLHWFHQSFHLIQRRILSYGTLVVLFFSLLYLFSHAIQSVQHSMPAIALLIAFLICGAFMFYFFLAGLIMISHCSDHSQHISLKQIMHAFLPGQKTFFKMSFIAICLGLFYWVLSVQLSPDANLLVMSEKTISLLSDQSTAALYIFKTGAVFLYFLLLVMYSLRTFFSAPLVIFHGLDYEEARALSQKGLLKNINAMSHVLICWFVVLMGSMIFAPLLAIALLPLFATFGYVSYRHIFLGQGKNEAAVELRQFVTS